MLRAALVVLSMAGALACAEDPGGFLDAGPRDALPDDRARFPDAIAVDAAARVDAATSPDAAGDPVDAEPFADAAPDPDAAAAPDAAPAEDAGSSPDAGAPFDECANVIDLSIRGTRMNQILVYDGNTSTTAATGSLPGPSCLPEIGHPRVHRYTPRVDGALTVTLNDPATLFDTVAWALDSCSASAAELGCNDNGDDAPRPSASTFAILDARRNVPIDIVVAGFRAPSGVAASGAYRLAVREALVVPAGSSCDPSGLADICAFPSSCIPTVADPTLGRCEAPCQFSQPLVCPAGTQCNGRAGTPDVSCVTEIARGQVCDPNTFMPTNMCEAPTNCMQTGSATVATCTTPRYVESIIPSPVFVDACLLGDVVMNLTDLDDGSSGMIPLPFAFSLYGVAYNEIWASTNGYAVLGMDPPSNATFGPPSVGDGPAIGVLWDDLIFDRNGARICTFAMGNRFYMQWENAYRVRYFGPAANPMRLTFELVLDGTNDTVEMIYQTLTPTTGANAPFANGLNAHIGVQAPFAADYTLHFGRVSTTQGLRFTP